MTRRDSGAPSNPRLLGSLCPHECPQGTQHFPCRGPPFRGMALLSLREWHKANELVLQVRTEFLSGRKRPLGMAGVHWEIGREDKERSTEPVWVIDRKMGIRREEHTRWGKGDWDQRSTRSRFSSKNFSVLGTCKMLLRTMSKVPFYVLSWAMKTFPLLLQTLRRGLLPPKPWARKTPGKQNVGAMPDGAMPDGATQSRKGVGGLEGKTERNCKIQQKEEFSSECLENLSHPKSYPQHIEKNPMFPSVCYMRVWSKKKKKNFFSKASMSPVG